MDRSSKINAVDMTIGCKRSQGSLVFRIYKQIAVKPHMFGCCQLCITQTGSMQKHGHGVPHKLVDWSSQTLQSNTFQGHGLKKFMPAQSKKHHVGTWLEYFSSGTHNWHEHLQSHCTPAPSLTKAEVFSWFPEVHGWLVVRTFCLHNPRNICAKRSKNREDNAKIAGKNFPSDQLLLDSKSVFAWSSRGWAACQKDPKNI